AAALGREKDLLELASHLVSGGRKRELGIGADDEEEVLEVVGHSARGQADGLHLLRLAHLLPDPALLCDVLEDADRTLWSAELVHLDVTVHLRPDRRAVRASHAPLERIRLGATVRRVELLCPCVPVLAEEEALAK